MALGYDVTFPMPLGSSMAMYAAIGGLSAVLANRGLSVFHDGLRPTMSSMRSGELSRKEVSKISFSLAWGFLWAFGIPFSLGFVVPLVYMIFMLSDFIGVSCPGDHSKPWYRTRTSLQGVAMAFGGGAVYGAAAAALLHVTSVGMKHLPIQMATPVQLFTQPALGAFFLFAVLTAAYHFGVRKAVPTAVAAALAWFVAAGLEWSQPASWSFGAAFVVLIAQMVRQQRRSRHVAAESTVAAWALEDDDEDEDGEGEQDDFLFGQVGRIKKGIVPLVILSALMGAAYNWGFMTKDPLAGQLYALGLAVPSMLVMLAWMFAYVPMKFTTAAVTGCMATGTFLDAGVAVLMPDPLTAAIVVGLLRIVEVWSILPIVRLVERFPTIREVADLMRTAIFHVMEIGFLIGAGFAAYRFAGQWGTAFVIGAWWINSRANSPVMPVAIGAFSALIVGLVANLLHVVGVSLT
jgi:Protein of unknown function